MARSGWLRRAASRSISRVKQEAAGARRDARPISRGPSVRAGSGPESREDGDGLLTSGKAHPPIPPKTRAVQKMRRSLLGMGGILPRTWTFLFVNERLEVFFRSPWARGSPE